MPNAIMVGFVVLKVVMLSVTMLNVVILSIIMLSVIMLNVIMLSVTAPILMHFVMQRNVIKLLSRVILFVRVL